MARSPLLKTKVLDLLLRMARWHPLRPVTAFLYRRMNRFLPVDRLGENAHWMAIHHPKPDYPLHILILPKQEIPSILLAPGDDPTLYVDLFQLVQKMIADFNLETQGYRLISNGGSHQSIPIWHWHLISEDPGESHA